MEEFERFINVSLFKIRSVMVSNTEDILADAARAGLLDKELTGKIRVQFDNPGDDPRKWFHYNSWKFPTKFKGYCDLPVICYNMQASTKVEQIGRCIRSCTAGIFAYQNISAHTHITKPETVFSLAATANELLHGLVFKSANDISFYGELNAQLKLLFSPDNSFLNQIFDTDDFSNPQLIDNERFVALGAQNDHLKQIVENLEGKLTDKNTDRDVLLEENSYLRGREEELNKTILRKDTQIADLKNPPANCQTISPIIAPVDNQVTKNISPADISEPTTEEQSIFNVIDKLSDKSVQQEDDLIEVHNDIITNWDEFSSELLTLRNRIKWSQIRPENWENILSKKIIGKFRSAEITSIEQWKSYPGINYLYKKYQEIMDKQLDEFWSDIDGLVKVYHPIKTKCPKCERIKVIEDFFETESQLSRDVNSSYSNVPCKQCNWHEGIRLLD